MCKRWTCDPCLIGHRHDRRIKVSTVRGIAFPIRLSQFAGRLFASSTWLVSVYAERLASCSSMTACSGSSSQRHFPTGTLRCKSIPDAQPFRRGHVPVMLPGHSFPSSFENEFNWYARDGPRSVAPRWLLVCLRLLCSTAQHVVCASFRCVYGYAPPTVECGDVLIHFC